MVKGLKLNRNHCLAAQDLLAQTVIEQQGEVAIHQSEDQRNNILQLKHRPERAHRMVMGKFNRQPTPIGHLQLGQTVSTLYATQPPLTWQATGEGDTAFTREAEVLAALRKTKIGKAPGPDGIPNAALHTLVPNYPSILTKMYNTCLIQRTFPIGWKRQRLVLIPKPGKLNDDPSSHRPLCMLSTTGKIFERIICTHFGFRRKRSTIDAIQVVTQLAANAIEGERWLGGSKEYCLVCTLDVKNAFNSANWNLVLQALFRM